MKRITPLFLAMLLVPAALCAAGGIGGIGFGYQYFDAQLSSANYDMAYIMGYGYGTSWDGGRIGGFGMSLVSTDDAAAGGVGGIVAGHEWRARQLLAAFTLFAGVGGVSADDAGYLVGFGEADFELGFRFFPWMQVVAYVGYQAWGNLIPGPAFNLMAAYTPVFGIRIGWGGY